MTSLNLTYHIDKIDNGKAYVSEISAFTKYDKGAVVDGLDYPYLSMRVIKIDGNSYVMEDDDRNILISPTWEWEAKVIYLNEWYDIGTSVSILSVLMLDSALVSYRQVKLETQITLP